MNVDLLGTSVAQGRSDSGDIPVVDRHRHERSAVIDALAVVGGVLVVGSGTKNGARHSTENRSSSRAGGRGPQRSEQGAGGQKWPHSGDKGQTRRCQQASTSANCGATEGSACCSLGSFVRSLVRSGVYVDIAARLAIYEADGRGVVPHRIKSVYRVLGVHPGCKKRNCFRH